MNQFSSLDLIYPCGADRKAGEVVSVRVRLDGVTDLPIFLQWKRKAWYVDASVNAFHMHRGLCRELDSSTRGLMSRALQRELKKRLAEIVLSSYRRNAVSNEQYFDHLVFVFKKSCSHSWEPIFKDINTHRWMDS